MAKKREEGYVPASYAGILRYKEDDLKRHIILKPEHVLAISIIVGLLILLLSSGIIVLF